MVEKFIYNLEFPPYITEFKIGNYVFKRIDKYSDAFAQLQHLVDSIGSEYPTKVQTGTHQITAKVELPDNETAAVLPWGIKDAKQILDILLLLTLFTGRNVFIKDWKDEGSQAIMTDHRQHLWGAQLLLSIDYEPMWKHKSTGELKNASEMTSIPVFDYNQIDIGFEKSLNKILALISSPAWREKYSNGYFLLLFKQAIQRQIIETSFILCWSIWEHIFTLNNKTWLDDRTMETLGGYQKIAFVLNKYFLITIDKKAAKEIGRLVKTRNRIVHFGMKAENTNFDEMKLFIRLTEQLIAIILELRPSNVFNSMEQLQSFLSGE